MIHEIDRFEIPQKYKDMSLEELQQEKERLRKLILQGDQAAHKKKLARCSELFYL